MPKWDSTRNYYADLELPPTATVEEIKKQFKRLALKYHPDRNPGREAEVNPKFQVIQSAHEVLSDTAQKRQYDDARRAYTPRFTSSGFGASNVKGNPWANVGKSYPPPPQRQRNPPGPTSQQSQQARPKSGAERYQSFTANMPRAPRARAAPDDTQFRRNNAEAWDNLRPNSTRKTAQPPPPPFRAEPSFGRFAPAGRAPTSAARDPRPEPPPAPPRTAYQKQKAEAAFGTSKKNGYTPTSQGVADEPPVTNKNYFTNRTHSYLFTQTEPTAGTTSEEPSAPGSDRDENTRAGMEDHLPDFRQRTPYHNSGGEKTSLFDSTFDARRPASTRSPEEPVMPGGFPRSTRRSPSPLASSNDGDTEDLVGSDASRKGAAGRRSSTTPAQPKASEPLRSKPAQPSPGIPPQAAPMPNFPPQVAPMPNFPPQPAATATFPPPPPPPPPPAPPSVAKATPESSTPSSSAAGRESRGPSVYASHRTPSHLSFQFTPEFHAAAEAARRSAPPREGTFGYAEYQSPSTSSEDGSGQSPCSLTPMEIRQKMAVNHLVKARAEALKKSILKKYQHLAGKENLSSLSDLPNQDPRKQGANRLDSSSFNFTGAPNAGDNGGAPTKSSTENINTTFVDNESPEDWQFKAGSASAGETTPAKRPHSRHPTTRRTAPFTTCNLSIPITGLRDTPGEASATNTKFAWNERIGPEHFEPQPTPSASGSPTRRPNSRKTKSFKMTAGTAAVVDEDDSEDAQEPSRSSGAPIAADAMDIDSPTPTKPEDIPSPVNINRARKYSIEPHREEWRAGDVNGVGPKTTAQPINWNGIKVNLQDANGGQPMTDATKQFPSRESGSEDTRETALPTFKDFKKVEPFTDPSPTGLKSFDDLKTTLPFESRAADQIPPDIRPPACLLNVPAPPVAPRLPPTMGVAGLRPNASSFRKYAQDFENYMVKWETFNDKVITHLTTRRDDYKMRCKNRGPKWLESCAPSYLIELDQDLDVQKKYAEACAEHRKRVAEYMEFKDRVK